MNTNEGDTPEKNNSAIKIPNEIKGLIGEPPLLEGENPDDFWSLFQAVAEEQNPQGMMDWFAAIDMTIKSWEELRLHRSSAALIRGSMLDALIYFLKVIKPPKRPELVGSNKNLALEYFSKKPKEKEQVLALLAQHGITLAALHAKAAELSGEPLQMFERMIAARGTERRRLRKEFQFQPKRQQGDPNLNSDG